MLAEISAAESNTVLANSARGKPAAFEADPFIGGSASDYCLLAGGAIPFILKYSTIWP